MSGLYLVSLLGADGRIDRVQVAGQCCSAEQAGREAEDQRKGSRWFMSRSVKQADPEIPTIGA